MAAKKQPTITNKLMQLLQKAKQKMKIKKLIYAVLFSWILGVFNIASAGELCTECLKNVPKEMIEASFIDGANFYICYYKIFINSFGFFTLNIY